MMMVFLKPEKETVNLILVCAPNISKTNAEKETLCDKIHNLLDTTTINSKTKILTDFNLQVGNISIDRLSKFNEETSNVKSERLREMCLLTSLRISNTELWPRNTTLNHIVWYTRLDEVIWKRNWCPFTLIS